jgi:hypothetical protein
MGGFHFYPVQTTFSLALNRPPVIEALADYKKTGEKIHKRMPAFWNRRYPIEEELKGYEY